MQHIFKNKKELEHLYSKLFANHEELFNIFSYTSRYELVQLYQLALLQPHGSNIIEIGSHLGASACFLALAAKTNMMTVHCVDTWYNDAMSEQRYDTYGIFLKNTTRYRKWIRAYRGNSHQVAKHFKKEASFLFIDADHSYEGCKSDIQVWIPLMKKGATVVFHDFYGKAGRIGIQQAVKELIYPVQKNEGYILESLYWTQI